MDSMFCNDGMNEKTNMEAAYDNMNYFIVCTLVYGLGLTIGCWFVSRCLQDKEDILEDIFEDILEEEELYEDKYPLQKDLSGNSSKIKPQLLSQSKEKNACIGHINMTQHYTKGDTIEVVINPLNKPNPIEIISEGYTYIQFSRL